MRSLRKYQELYVGLEAHDRERLAQLTAARNMTKCELAREAIRWYLDNYDQLNGKRKEDATAHAIRYATDKLVQVLNSGVDRICKMLARQGRAIGTLYELSWMSLPDDENARKAFEEAASLARQKMARHVQRDESELAERMKKVVNA